MNAAFLVLALALVWAAISGNFSGLNLLFGGMLGAVAVYLLRHSLSGPGTARRLRRILSLAVLFFYELMMSAIRVALIVVRPNMALRPAIVAVPITLKSDAEIALLANLITLTPGTLSVDLSGDRGILYVHALDMSDRDALIADIVGGFEKKVREVFE